MSELPKSEEYDAMLREWYAELLPVCAQFFNQFKDEKYGDEATALMKMMFALNMIVEHFCGKVSVPPEHLGDFITTVTGVWFQKGRPATFAISAVSAEEIQRIVNSRLFN